MSKHWTVHRNWKIASSVERAADIRSLEEFDELRGKPLPNPPVKEKEKR